ncbi:DoxX family protein [Arcobacter peruensis]|uniref:DoxX family protein n=1 Tax=Arcobacter peruensis TaxID=2320140 RepID=UPI000F0988E8|nr:DoxX family protein [Arcobacter peruensis]
MKSKIFNIKNLYLLTTGIIVILVGLFSGVVDILQTQGVISASQELGYPLYFFTLLGIFKILGAIALVLPRKFESIKLVAYSGFAFDFIFASFSHFSIGDSFTKILTPLVFLIILAISYKLKDKY